MPSVIDQDPFNEYMASGVTTVFPYTFQLLLAADLKVTLDGAYVSPGLYTISGIGNIGGGSVTFLSAPAASVKVLLSREMTLSRDTDYQYNGDLLEATLDKDFNRIWHAIQGVQARLDGAVRAPYPSQISELPSLLASNLGKGFGVNALGNPDYLSTDFGSTDADVTFYTAAGAGAVQTTVAEKFQHEVSVMDYIPLANRAAILAGTSVVINTAGVLAAIAYATPVLPGNPWDLNGSKGGLVTCPRGRFIVDATIFIPAWVTFQGAGRAATQFYWGSAGPGPVFSMGRPGLAEANDPLQSFHCCLRDLTIFGNYLNVTGLAIYASFWDMYSVCVARCNNDGIYLETSYTGKAYSTWVFYCGTTAGKAGIRANGRDTSGSGANDISWYGGSLAECYDLVRMEQSDQMTFEGFSFQSGWRHGINFAPNTIGVYGTSLINCHWEANSYAIAGSSIHGALSSVSLERSYFARQGALHQKHIAAISMGGCKIINNRFDDLASPTGFIGLSNDAAVSCTFIRNTISGNESANDSIPLFTPTMKVFVDAQLNPFANPTLNRVDHLTQYRWQVSDCGLHTVTLTPATSGSITLNAAFNTMAFTKVGRLVTVQGRIQATSVSSPVGTNIRMSLPYPIATLSEEAGKIGGIVIRNSTIVLPFTGAETNSFINVFIDASTFTGSDNISFSFSYLT